MLETLNGRVRALRGAAQTRHFQVSTQTLQTADQVIDRVRKIPVIGLFWLPAERFVEWRLQTWTNPHIDDYDSLNAKKAIAAVRELDDLYSLLAAHHRESQTKQRKTVLRAIEDRLSKLDAAA
jgi:hypothetical protein